MRTPEQNQQIEEYEYNEDITDAEKEVIRAEYELKEAQKWLAKQKVYYAKAIIKLHNYLKENGEII